MGSSSFSSERRKLRMLNNAVCLDDLRIPPANRLEASKGDRRGRHRKTGRRQLTSRSENGPEAINLSVGPLALFR
jgi:plasmid maintenance system killer protein